MPSARRVWGPFQAEAAGPGAVKEALGLPGGYAGDEVLGVGGGVGGAVEGGGGVLADGDVVGVAV